jgi:predicted RNA-binding protein with PIN domain
MRWLIDGYNVIRRDPDLRAAESESLHAGRQALLRLVAEGVRRSGDRFTVVFDGAPLPGPAAHRGQIEVIFARPPQKADDLLMKLARQVGDGGVVVSSDRAVLDAAGRAGCVPVTAEAFSSALTTSGGDIDSDDNEDDAPTTKRGNPRRRSWSERSAARVLRRLSG